MRFGRYELSDRLREGRMSETFLARPIDGAGDGEPLCVVRLLGALRESGRTVEIFIESSKALLGLRHPNVVAILEFDENEGWPYLVTEHHQGVLCSELLKRSQESGLELSGAESVFIAHQVLQALTALHGFADASGRQLGLLHGDVGPDRVFICPDGRIMLDCAFAGTQQLHNLRSSTITAREQSFRFSPEQVLGLSFDHRADIFNAAVMLVELLIRRPLFIERSQLSTLLSIRDVKLDILNANRQRLPPKMELVLLKALSKDPDGRYASAAEMAELLTPYFGALSAEDLQVGIAELVSAISSTEAASSQPHEEPEPEPGTDADRAPITPRPEPIEKPMLQVVAASSPPPKPVTDVHTRPTPQPPPPKPTPIMVERLVPSPSPAPANDGAFDMVIEALADPASEAMEVDLESSNRPTARAVHSPAHKGPAAEQPPAGPGPKRTTKPGLGMVGGPGAKKTTGAALPKVSGAVAEPGPAPRSRSTAPAPRPAADVDTLRDSGPGVRQSPMWAELDMSDSDSFWSASPPPPEPEPSPPEPNASEDKIPSITMPIGIVSFRRAGRIEGPFNLPTAIDKVSIGEFTGDDEASINDGPFQPVADVDEFKELLPPRAEPAAPKAEPAAPKAEPAPSRPARRPSLVPPETLHQPPDTSAAEELGPATRAGLLDDERASRVLFRLKLDDATCLVVFEHGPIRKDVYLSGGDPVSVSSNIASESLPEYLVRKDALSRMELEMALAMKGRFDDDLGEALDGLGIMASAVYEGLSRDHLRAVLLELFRWSKGEFRIYADRRPPQPGVRTGLSPFSLILEGLRARMSPDDAEAWVKEHGTCTVDRLTPPDEMLGRFKLPEISGRALRALTASSARDVSRIVADLGGEDAGDRYHIALTICLAEELAVIRLTPPSA